MNNRFLISVAAAALIAGTGFANAQGTGTGKEAPAGGAAVQQNAPAGGAASSSPTARDAAEPTKTAPGLKSTQSDTKTPATAGTNQRAEDNMQGQKSKGMSSETNDGAKGGKDMKAEGRDSKMNSAQSKDGTNSKEGMSKEGMSKDGTGSAQNKSGSTESKTTGNAATAATAAPPAEKRTEISSAIRSEKVEEVTSVNFNISVGAAIPATVRFHPLPSRIVEIYPEWRGYEFILVHGRYIVVRPQTREIVYIIEG